MQIALVHNHFNQDHLEAVKQEMQEIGAPVIRAVWMECYGVWAALEGCHRIRAAKELGIEPIIEEIEYSDDPISSIGCEADEDYAISDICDGAYRAIIISFDD